MPDIMQKAKEKGVKIHLPTDYVCADKFAEDAKTMVRTNKEGIDDGWLGLDVGPKSIAANAEVIRRSKTVFLEWTTRCIRNASIRSRQPLYA